MLLAGVFLEIKQNGETTNSRLPFTKMRFARSIELGIDQIHCLIKLFKYLYNAQIASTWSIQVTFFDGKDLCRKYSPYNVI